MTFHEMLGFMYTFMTFMTCQVSRHVHVHGLFCILLCLWILHVHEAIHNISLHSYTCSPQLFGLLFAPPWGWWSGTQGVIWCWYVGPWFPLLSLSSAAVLASFMTVTVAWVFVCSVMIWELGRYIHVVAAANPEEGKREEVQQKRVLCSVCFLHLLFFNFEICGISVLQATRPKVE